jgi:hydroxyethylthiazole kinase-like uncharacterized protein yjeF
LFIALPKQNEVELYFINSLSNYPMQTLLNSSQMRDADANTITTAQINSLDLMEKAAKAFVKVFVKEVKDEMASIAVICGQGNNGGDGLAIARLLKRAAYQHIKVYLINFGDKRSKDFESNLAKLIKRKIKLVTINNADDFDLTESVVIDAVFGAGLNRSLSAAHKTVFAKINAVGKKIFAVDVPSGFPPEGKVPMPYEGVRADLAICFQRPKINFFFPESAVALKRFKTVEIGLSETFIENQQSDWLLTTADDIVKLIKPREKFSHKGTYGHVLLFAGNTNTMGAALLAANACLHTGAGLTTVCLPESGLTALNTALPEVMALPRTRAFDADLEKFTAIGVGPGLGTAEEEVKIFEKVIRSGKPIVIDADALNIISERTALLALLPQGSILTPHLKEFDRIFGHHQTWWDRLETARCESFNRKIVIVLKNQYTFVCLPNGTVKINPTGNAAMASGGMGDVLTGMIVALLAQSYAPAEAATLAVYLHGKTGDRLAKKYAVVTASAVVNEISKVIKKLGS